MSIVVFYNWILPLLHHLKYYQISSYICPHADKNQITYYNHSKNKFDFLSKKVDDYLNFDKRVNATRLQTTACNEQANQYYQKNNQEISSHHFTLLNKVYSDICQNKLTVREKNFENQTYQQKVLRHISQRKGY